MDIMATCLDVTGIAYPETYKGQTIEPLEGISIMPILRKKKFAGHQTLAWEHEGGKAFRAGDWKISALRNRDWELFNLATDRTETKNLATENPEKLKELMGLWEDWAGRMKIEMK
jgi:arylsulfatase